MRLVGDPELAEDLAQEACVVALQQAPGGIQTMRAWLSTVLRNLVRERARSEERALGARNRVRGPKRSLRPTKCLSE